MKTCTKCKQDKELSEFHKNKNHKSNHHVHCKQCRSVFSKEHVKRLSRQSRSQKLKRVFGISDDIYDEILEKQSFKCAICDRHEKELTRKLAVDHDHVTGEVRGLLCSNCNTGIGNLRDSTELLEKAIYYLNSWKALTGE